MPAKKSQKKGKGKALSKGGEVNLPVVQESASDEEGEEGVNVHLLPKRPKIRITKTKKATEKPTEDAEAEAEGDGGGDADADADVEADVEGDGDEPATKKRKLTVMLSEDQEEGLVEWFQEHELFYNQKLKEFKLKDKKDRMLSDKAKELKISLAELKAWLQSMRTMFGRLQKKKSGQATPQHTARQQWILASFSFLAPHLVLKTDTRQLGLVSTLIVL